MDLAAFETTSEYNSFATNVFTPNVQYFKPGGSATNVIIGGILAAPGNLNTLSWVSTGKLVSYKPSWAYGQPDSGGGQACIAFLIYTPTSFGFNDINCNAETFSYVCEMRSPK